MQAATRDPELTRRTAVPCAEQLSKRPSAYLAGAAEETRLSLWGPVSTPWANAVCYYLEVSTHAERKEGERGEE
jgi:hypothetical protein